MAEEKSASLNCCTDKKGWHGGASSGVYGLGFLGAAIYFIQNATSFWDGVIGVLQAIVWPAVLVYRIMQFLNL